VRFFVRRSAINFVIEGIDIILASPLLGESEK
jgi:hypothetical protein